jgi:hypothetical protein
MKALIACIALVLIQCPDGKCPIMPKPDTQIGIVVPFQTPCPCPECRPAQPKCYCPPPCHCQPQRKRFGLFIRFRR